MESKTLRKGIAHKTYTWSVLLLFAVLPAISSGCSADCSWNGKTQAFVDENANTRWDSGEPPLSGVKFYVHGNGGYGGEAVSDSAGSASIAFFVSCNRNTNFVVYAEPPESYKPTTPESVDAGSESGKTFTFGFAKEK